MPLATAMILAAGRGERMRPLTDHTPKPLLKVRGQALMDWHVRALAQGGFRRLVVNTDWLGDQVPTHLAPLARELGCEVAYSNEGQDFGGALETAGGIARALPLLADVFWVVAGDVFVPDFVFAAEAVQRFTQSGQLAHLWLVPNPAHNPRGDFGLTADGLALNLPADSPEPRFTFSTIALYRHAFFEAAWCDLPAGNATGVKAALAPMLRAGMDQGVVSAEVYSGVWTDVGTPERLRQLNQ